MTPSKTAGARRKSRRSAEHSGSVQPLRPAPPFIHVRTHSAYSLLEGAIPLSRLIDLAVADRQPALGLCDTNNLFGALEFAQQASARGLQPIIGCQIAFDAEDTTTGNNSSGPMGGSDGGVHTYNDNLSTLVLLVQSEQGYKNLLRLISDAYVLPKPEEAFHETSVSITELCKRSEGLIALTGGAEGPIGQALLKEDPDRARQRLETLAEIFPNRLYVELQRHGREAERQSESAMIALAYDLALPLVATNEPFFATSDDFEAHDALIAIAEGSVIGEDNRRRLTQAHYFKSAAEMVALFADLPEALASTVEIAKRCAYRPRIEKPVLPRFADAAGAEPGASAEALDEVEAKALRVAAHEGLTERLERTGTAADFTGDDYRARLDFEIEVIAGMKYPGYFLIVADFIKWAKAQGIPVGPGRGSGAGSLVAYALTITDIDPLRYNIPFERFLNPERVSMPDFDIDFCQDRRDEVIQYVSDKYGADHVAQIITFGTLQARAVLRDVGRVLEMPYGQVDRICKLVPNNPAEPVSLREAIAGEPQLKDMGDNDALVARLFRIALTLEGLFRHASTHAAGIVIGDRPLRERVPLYRVPRAHMPATQFNLKWVEAAGLVKFDFLGLKTLTVIERAVKMLRAQGTDIDINAIPLDDEATFAMLGKGETVGVFQLESSGMRRALMELNPDRLEDIIAMVALYRPGPMASIPNYCARKNGIEPIDYIHPALEPILNESFGVIVYQEQVMQIARDLADYTLGEADLLRRAMGKKIKSEMDAHRSRFVEGAMRHGVDKKKADVIFDLMAKFSGYGFNKGHSAPYALIAYQTAWLKANHPAEFLAASMTLDMNNTDKLADFAREAARLSIRVRPPDINVSTAMFHVDEQEIVYALAAIKGVGRQAVEEIVAQRGEGTFSSIADFAAKITPRMVNKRTLEGLIAAGALDALEPNRARLFCHADSLLAHGGRVAQDAALGQGDMFGGTSEPDDLALPQTDPWDLGDRLHREFEAIGFYLSAHPLDSYLPHLGALKAQTWADFSQSVRTEGTTAGRLLATVASKRERRIRSGGRMIVLTCSDPTGLYEAVLFSDGVSQFRDLLEPGQSVVLTVSAEAQGEDVRVRVQNVDPLGDLSGAMHTRLHIHLSTDTALALLANQVAEKRNSKDKGQVLLILTQRDALRAVEMRLPGGYALSPELAGAIKAIPGVDNVVLT